MINGHATGIAPKVRCAIYTRKSTEEGLDQEFNSLDAQREAAEAYIVSQMHEGWIALPDQYNDGGYSGGNTERPGLKKLLAQIEDGHVDCVVVYKVDRLSRSLMDFAQIIDLFEKNGATFVSVTQSFNTTSSMGRLTLNILLSFAQFEREIIGERIRDKVAASKKKGKYTGGMPVLGYDVDRSIKRLVVNEEEAQLVRFIFEEFVKMGSATKLAQKLNRLGHKTKSWTTLKGKHRPGRSWNKGHLYKLLNNRLYIGQVVHKDKHYPGEHDAIIGLTIWKNAKKILSENCKVRGNKSRSKTHALLKGIIRCGNCDMAMGPTFTRKNGKQYRYYLCVNAAKNGYATCPICTVAAGEIEGAVIDQLRAIFRSPEMIAQTYRAAKQKEGDEIERLRGKKKSMAKNLGELRATATDLLKAPDNKSDGLASLDTFAENLTKINVEIEEAEKKLTDIIATLTTLEAEAITENQVKQSLGQIDLIWDELFPGEQTRIVQLLVEKVVVNSDGLNVQIRTDGLQSLVVELDGTVEGASQRRKTK